jgi:hypothetical protein
MINIDERAGTFYETIVPPDKNYPRRTIGKLIRKNEDPR